MTHKPTLCLDFDGVLHAYTSGWQGEDKVTDGPVPGAVEFLVSAVEEFTVAIYSTRSATFEGRTAMQTALRYWLCEAGADWRVFDQLQFPETKPAAFLSIDDRAVTFTGTFPDVKRLHQFTPWTQRKPDDDPCYWNGGHKWEASETCTVCKKSRDDLTGATVHPSAPSIFKPRPAWLKGYE